MRSTNLHFTYLLNYWEKEVHNMERTYALLTMRIRQGRLAEDDVDV